MYNTMWKSLVFCAALLGFAPTAQAITIGGNTYDEVLKVSTKDAFGLWNGTMFMTTAYNYSGVAADKVSSVDFISSLLAGTTPASFIYKGTANGNNAQVTGGLVELFDSAGQSILDGSFVSNGRTSTTHGILEVAGLFTATGGSWASNSLFTGPFYVDAQYAINSFRADIHAGVGSLTIYALHGSGNTSVPEPATCTLFGLGLLGAARKRRRSTLS